MSTARVKNRGCPQPPRETRFAAAACARHRRQPERARRSLPVNDRELIKKKNRSVSV